MVIGNLLHLCSLVSLAILGSTVATDNLNLNGYKINVEGYEKIQISRPDGKAVSLSPSGFFEKDQHGKDVPGMAHKVDLTDMAAQNVTVADPCSRLIPNSNTEGRFLNVDAILEGDQQTVNLGYDIYYVTADGAFILNKELQRIYANNVILTLTLDGWKWCSPCDGDDGASVTGAFLDVNVVLELPDGSVVEEQDVRNGPRELNLGNRMTLYLSNQVKTDGKWKTMPTGYPMLSEIPEQANSYKMVIRLPKFEKRVLYDPVISIDDDDVTFTQPANDTSKVTCSGNNGGDQPVAGADKQVTSLWCFLLILPLFSLCPISW